MRNGHYQVRFYSRDPWPFYSASVIVEHPIQVWEAFDRFKTSAREHATVSHLTCDCCFHPGRKDNGK